ncbi:hypothetical protein AAEX28_10715 [Lentisphaerota bacterium WC36G]|nr:hypothetical protein LJT99_13560 [Lentisphaerae bacterium WC36]
MRLYLLYILNIIAMVVIGIFFLDSYSELTSGDFKFTTFNNFITDTSETGNLHRITILKVIGSIFIFFCCLISIFVAKKALNKVKQEAAISTDKVINIASSISLREITSGFKHEISQPLFVVRGYLELLESVLGDNEVVRRFNLENCFEKSVSSVDNAVEILDKLSKFIYSDNCVKSFSPIKEAEYVVDIFNSQLRNRGISIYFNSDEELKDITFNINNFYILITMLLVAGRNSFVGLEDKLGKRIDFYIRRENSSLIIEIQDNGNGIVKSCEDASFLRFSDVRNRVDDSLTYARVVAESNNGVFNESHKYDEGSTIVISFADVF